MLTPKSAPNALAHPLRARIRRALDFSRVPNIGFVDRQIAIYKEYLSRHQSRVTISNQLQTMLATLESIAQLQHWSRRKLAAKIGIPGTTLRRLKHNQASPEVWLPKLQSAAARLQPV